MMICLVTMARLAGAQVAPASGGGLTVKAADPVPLIAAARTIVTVVFMIDNTDTAAHTASPMLILPPGWRSMAPIFPMELDPGSGDIVLGSFIIPGDARAGSYRVSCGLEGAVAGTPDQTASMEVVVPILRSLELSAVSAPKNALSGDGYESRFVAANNGNVEEAVEVQVESGNGFAFDQDARVLVLPPGGSRELLVTVHVPKVLERAGRHTVTMRLVSTAGGIENPEARTTVELIPRIPAGEIWHRLPLSVSADSSFGQGETSTWSYQGSISGRGTLDDGDTMNLAFSLEPPSRTPADDEAAGAAGASPTDEEATDEELRDLSNGSYYLGFWTSAFGIHAGDRSYTVSTLTSGAQSGRGVEAFLARGTLSLRGFADAQGTDDGTGLHYGAALKYGTDAYSFIALNYFNKASAAADGIYGLEGFLRPYDSANIAFEAASGGAGTGDYVYSLGIDGREEGYSYQLKTLRAGAAYQGAVRDKELYSANGSLSVFQNVTVSAGYNKETANPSLFADVSALSTDIISANLAWGLGEGTRFTAQWKSIDRKDLSAGRSVDEHTESIEAKLESVQEKLQLDGSVSLNTYTDLLRPSTRKSSSYGLTAKYRHDSDLTISLSAKYSGGAPLLTVRDGVVSFSASLDYEYRDATAISAGFKTVNHLDSYLEGSDSASLSLRHEFSNDATLSLVGSYSPDRNPENPDSVSVSVSLSLPMSVPVSRRTNIGTLQGRVFEAETGLGAAGILVSLEGMTAVTDKDGVYLFPAVTAGTYKLQVNTSVAGLDLIPDNGSQDKVVITDKSSQTVDIALTRPVRIYGVINQYTTEGGMLGASGAELLFEKGLPNILCEVSNGTEAWRTLSDASGKFSFPRLLSGRWVLKVYDKNIPSTHYVEQLSREFIVEPGAAAEAEIRIIPRIRNIIFVEEELALGTD